MEEALAKQAILDSIGSVHSWGGFLSFHRTYLQSGKYKLSADSGLKGIILTDITNVIWFYDVGNDDVGMIIFTWFVFISCKVMLSVSVIKKTFVSGCTSLLSCQTTSALTGWFVCVCVCVCVWTGDGSDRDCVLADSWMFSLLVFCAYRNYSSQVLRQGIFSQKILSFLKPPVGPDSPSVSDSFLSFLVFFFLSAFWSGLPLL